MNILLLLYAFSATPLFIFLISRAIRAKGKHKKLFSNEKLYEILNILEQQYKIEITKPTT